MGPTGDLIGHEIMPFSAVDVRVGSISTELGGSRYVRFPTDSDRIADIPDWQLRAINGSRLQPNSNKQLMISMVPAVTP
jgi:hypothetical protein